MEHRQNELRNRFTAWLEILIKRAKIDYIRSNKESIIIDSIEDHDHDKALIVEDCYDSIRLKNNTFEFEDKRMLKAFSCLPPKRQKILSMIYVEEKTPEEIAAELNCTVQNVYNRHSLTIKQLRELLK